jgi:hypothetical protein
MNDITFPTRLLSFAKSVKANCMMGQEEQEYIIITAQKMLDEQIKNATDQNEIDYLKRCHSILQEQKIIK